IIFEDSTDSIVWSMAALFIGVGSIWKPENKMRGLVEEISGCCYLELGEVGSSS
ncbi:23845_t:CDS:2, partial [Cetraspora pellucida]